MAKTATDGLTLTDVGNGNWLTVAAGGNATVGETTSNTFTVNGVAQLTTFTVSSLATAVPCSSTTAGALAYVTAASSPTWGTTLTGGSSSHTLAMCNGSNWTAQQPVLYALA